MKITMKKNNIQMALKYSFMFLSEFIEGKI
jgi:hypothetical protein